MAGPGVSDSVAVTEGPENLHSEQAPKCRDAAAAGLETTLQKLLL